MEEDAVGRHPVAPRAPKTARERGKGPREDGPYCCCTCCVCVRARACAYMYARERVCVDASTRFDDDTGGGNGTQKEGGTTQK